MDVKKLIEQYDKLSESKQDGGYFINSMIYFEGEDCDAEVIDFLEGSKYIVTTDYGITEFTKDNYDLMCNEFDNLGVEFKTKSDGKSVLTLDEVKKGLGDIARLFDENKIDLAIKVG